MAEGNRRNSMLVYSKFFVVILDSYFSIRQTNKTKMSQVNGVSEDPTMKSMLQSLLVRVGPLEKDIRALSEKQNMFSEASIRTNNNVSEISTNVANLSARIKILEEAGKENQRLLSVKDNTGEELSALKKSVSDLSARHDSLLNTVETNRKTSHFRESGTIFGQVV